MSVQSVKLVRKRDGRVVPFEQEKITSAIFKAAQAVGGDDYDRAVFISNVVVEMIDERYGEAVKRLVVEQIEGGKLTVAQAQRQHAIAGAQTIRGWQAKYGKAGGGVRRASALAAAQAEIGKRVTAEEK